MKSLESLLNGHVQKLTRAQLLEMVSAARNEWSNVKWEHDKVVRELNEKIQSLESQLDSKTSQLRRANNYAACAATMLYPDMSIEPPEYQAFPVTPTSDQPPPAEDEAARALRMIYNETR